MILFLKKCSNFKNETTELVYIIDLLGAILILTPKFHPKITGRGMEYYWGYARLHYRCGVNDTIANNLKANSIQTLDRDMITINRVGRFARKIRQHNIN